MPEIIEPRSGVAFRLAKGERLTVIDPEGEQVSDMVAFAEADTREVISSGRSLDYASKLFLSTGDPQGAVNYGAAHGALAMTTPGDTSMAMLSEVEKIMGGGSARIVR